VGKHLGRVRVWKKEHVGGKRSSQGESKNRVSTQQPSSRPDSPTHLSVSLLTVSACCDLKRSGGGVPWSRERTGIGVREQMGIGAEAAASAPHPDPPPITHLISYSFPSAHLNGTMVQRLLNPNAALGLEPPMIVLTIGIVRIGPKAWF